MDLVLVKERILEMNSKLRDILERLYGNAVVAHKTIGISNAKSVDVPEAEKAIRQAVGEEMLGLKPNNPYKTTDGQVPESFEAPAHAYDVANGDWEQKIKQWAALKESSNK